MTPSNYEVQKAALIDELRRAGIKHNPEQIVSIAKTLDGKIVFLEEGDRRRGLQHILAKADQFAKVGIDQDQIADAVIVAAVTGRIVGYQGKSHDRPRAIYEFTYKGETKYISLSVSKKIRLMVDYGCDPLWWEEASEVGDIDPETLPLSKDTIERLHKWAKTYDATINWFDPVDSPGFPSSEAEAAFEEEGISLWTQLQKELTPNYEVVYFSEKLGKVIIHPNELEATV